MLRLRVTAGTIYHLPYEHGVIRVRATWQRRPLARARVHIKITCPHGHASFVRRTRRDGRAVVTYGTPMPNWMRVYNCLVSARVGANGLSATSGHPTLHFIHPLWLAARHGNGGKVVIRVWGRRGTLFEIHVGDRIVGSDRIGQHGWVDIAPSGLHRGQMVWVRGRDGLASHLIRL
jgi:hypothetical protein